MNVAPPTELPRVWRAEAEHLKPYAPAAAVAYERAALELEQALAAAGDELLTLDAAAREAHMHPDSLRHLVSSGRIENAGRKGKPLIRRRDLPKRAPRLAGSGGYDPGADASELISKHRTA